MWLRHRQAWQAELMWHMKIKTRRSRGLFNILHVVSKEPKKQHLWDWSDPQKLSSSLNEPLHAALRRHLSCRREARRSRLTGVKHPKRSSYRIITERGHVRGREPIFFFLWIGSGTESKPQFPLCQPTESRDSALELKPGQPEECPRWGLQLGSRLSSTKLCDWLEMQGKEEVLDEPLTNHCY